MVGRGLTFMSIPGKMLVLPVVFCSSAKLISKWPRKPGEHATVMYWKSFVKF